MSDDKNFPLILIVMVIGGLLAILLLPPEMFDIRPDRADPVADAGSNTTVAFGQSAVLDGSGSSDDKGIQDYVWMIDNGHGFDILHGSTVTYLFGAPGEYSAILNVTDGAGKWDTDEITITVLDRAGENGTHLEVTSEITRR